MKMGEVGRTVRLGIIGLGGRGTGQTQLLMTMPDVEIVSVCDVYQDRVDRMIRIAREARGTAPKGYLDYRELLNDGNIEAVIIMTSWQTHIKIAVEAMEHGLPVAMEVGGASSVEECWRLVRTSEEMGVGCMLLENCCYGKEEMTLLRMIREGVFGTLVHCQGGYEHDLRDEIGYGDINRHYRQDNFRHRNGELYPTHELGPIAKYLNINRGNRLLSLVSMASKSVGEVAWMERHRPDLAGMTFAEGDIVTTMIKCAGGETILLTHDCTLPRPYSRGGRVQGTKGIWMEDNRSIYIDGETKDQPGAWTHTWEPDTEYMAKYEHPLWVAYDEFGTRGGHGGMDFLALRGFIESIQEEKPFPIDVYDTATWMAITTLSEQSVAMGSLSVPIPDFTNGRWLTKRPVNDGDYRLD